MLKGGPKYTCADQTELVRGDTFFIKIGPIVGGGGGGGGGGDQHFRDSTMSPPKICLPDVLHYSVQKYMYSLPSIRAHYDIGAFPPYKRRDAICGHNNNIHIYS